MNRDFRLKERRENELNPEILARILCQTAGEEEASKVYEEWTGEQIPDAVMNLIRSSYEDS